VGETMNVENSIEKCKEFMDKFVKRGYVIEFKSFGRASDAPDGTISIRHLARADVELKRERRYDIGDLISGEDGPEAFRELARVVFSYHILNRNLHPEEYAPDGKYLPKNRPGNKQTA